jgi:hypothetical protein
LPVAHVSAKWPHEWQTRFDARQQIERIGRAQETIRTRRAGSRGKLCHKPLVMTLIGIKLQGRQNAAYLPRNAAGVQVIIRGVSRPQPSTR